MVKFLLAETDKLGLQWDATELGLGLLGIPRWGTVGSTTPCLEGDINFSSEIRSFEISSESLTMKGRN